MGRFFLTLLSGFAELERAMICERTQAAMNYKRSKGERISNRIPYGHDLDSDGKTLVNNDREQRAISVMRRMRDMGASYQRIADRLTAHCIKTKTGNHRWSQQAVQRILKRPTVVTT